MMNEITARKIDAMITELAAYRIKNAEKEAVYEAKGGLPFALKSSTEKERALESVTGWGNIVIETLVELITPKGVKAPESISGKLQKIYRQNNLKTELKKMVREGAIYGTSYILLGYGDTSLGEPEILITVESPKYCLGLTNTRTGRIETFLKIVPNPAKKGGSMGFLYTLQEIVYFELNDGIFTQTGRADNPAGFVPAIRVDSNPRPSNEGGKSELTRSIRANYVMACDLLTDMRRAGKLYATPTRYLLNVAPEVFQDSDGNSEAMDAYMDKVWTFNGKGKDGREPKAGQFQSSSPAPFIEMFKQAAMNIAAEIGAEPEEFGFPGNQPAAGDALIVRRERRIKRATERILAMEPQLITMYKYALLMLDGELTEDADLISPLWEAPQPATPSASADAVSKLISAGVLVPDSEAVARMLGLTPEEVEENKKLRAAKARANILQDIKAAAGAAQASDPTVAASAQVNNATEVTG